MIRWKGKEYRNIFAMDIETLEDYCENSDDFKKLAEDFAREVEKDMKTNPYFNAEECCVWSCPHNSGNDHEVTMGEITRCHKFKWKEENTCDKIEHFWGD